MNLQPEFPLEAPLNVVKETFGMFSCPQCGGLASLRYLKIKYAGQVIGRRDFQVCRGACGKRVIGFASYISNEYFGPDQLQDAFRP